MKTIMMSLVLLIALFISATSQSFRKSSIEERARYFTYKMTEDLLLDYETETRIYKVNYEVSRRFDSLYQSGGDKLEIRKGAAQIYQYRNESFRQILSNVQYLKFDDLEREKREKKKAKQKITDSLSK